MEILPEPRWHDLVALLEDQKGISIILGATDSGKSTLAFYIIRELLSRKIPSALIDADIGQSSLGVPGTIGMKIFRSQDDLKSMRADRIAFIGSLNPSAKIAAMIKRTGRMVDLAKQDHDGPLIVDTTGLVDGRIGKEIKIGKIRGIQPDRIIALQRGDELEHILENVQGLSVVRLKPSKLARRRSSEARIRYRESLFTRYFRSAGILELSLHGRDCIYNEKPVSVRPAEIQKGTVLGLNHGEETIDVGVAEGVSDDTVILKTPLRSERMIDGIVIGDIIIQDRNHSSPDSS
jgi:polynucleotide 5'-hydroxyl-kinase GRC3/NOL9